MNLVDKVLAFEDGEMETEEEVVEFFQELVDTGMVGQLQGSYGRIAQNLIELGEVTVKNTVGIHPKPKAHQNFFAELSLKEQSLILETTLNFLDDTSGNVYLEEVEETLYKKLYSYWFQDTP